MPFITEEVWHAMYEGKAPLKSIALARYPEPDPRRVDDAVEHNMAVLQDLITTIRNLRAELKVEPKLKVPVRIFTGRPWRVLIEENRGMVERLGSVEGLQFSDQPLTEMLGARTTVDFQVALVYEQKVDATAERERLTKDRTKLENELANAHRQLGNEQFLAKAPANVVDGIRRRAGEVELLIEKVKTALGKLG
jgi:valyl-tRNA synthetase